jgi:hypothetical protein
MIQNELIKFGFIWAQKFVSENKSKENSELQIHLSQNNENVK